MLGLALVAMATACAGDQPDETEEIEQAESTEVVCDPARVTFTDKIATTDQLGVTTYTYKERLDAADKECAGPWKYQTTNATCRTYKESSLCGAQLTESNGSLKYHPWDLPSWDYPACDEAPTSYTNLSVTVTADGKNVYAKERDYTDDGFAYWTWVLTDSYYTNGDCVTAAKNYALSTLKLPDSSWNTTYGIGYTVTSTSRTYLTWPPSPSSTSSYGTTTSWRDTCSVYISHFPKWVHHNAEYDLRSNGRPVQPAEWACKGETYHKGPSGESPWYPPNLSKPWYPSCRFPRSPMTTAESTEYASWPIEPAGSEWKCGPVGIAYSDEGMTLATLVKSKLAASYLGTLSGDEKTWLPVNFATAPDNPSLASALVKPACMTGEDLTMADVPGKWSTLYQRWTATAQTPQSFPGVDATQLHRSLGAHLNLLFEMKGDALPGAAQEEAIVTYLDEAPPPACGNNIDLPDTSACSNSDEVNAMRPKMAFCGRMASSHVGDPVRFLGAVQDVCLEIGLDFEFLKTSEDDGKDPDPQHPDVDDVCHFKDYRALYRKYVTRPLQTRLSTAFDPANAADVKGYSGLPETTKDGKADGFEEAQLRLLYIDRWYRAIATMYGTPSAAVRKQRWTETNDVAGAFWRGIYRNLYPAGDAFLGKPLSSKPAYTAADLTAAAQDRLLRDQKIVHAAFSPMALPYRAHRLQGSALPITSPPLLYILGDAFATMVQRLDAIGAYHDLGCAYLGCSGGGGRSEATQLWNLLASLADGQKLATQINVETNLNLVKPDWLQVFSAIAANHVALEAAAVAALETDSYRKEQIELSGFEDPGPIMAFAPVVALATTKARNFATTGLVNGELHHDEIDFGISEDTMQGLLSLFSGRVGTLGNQTATYGSALVAAAQAIAQDIAQNTAINAAKYGLAQRVTQLAELDEQRIALANAREVANTTFAGYMESYSVLKDSNGQSLVQKSHFGPYNVDASHALGSGGSLGSSPVSTIAVPGVLVHGKAGEILQVQASGQYAPGCALTARVPGIGAPLAAEEALPLCSPEGYLLSKSNGVYTASSNFTNSEQTSAFTGGVEGKLCIGLKYTAGGIFGDAAGISAYAELEACGTTSYAKSLKDSRGGSQTNGTEARTSASFATGLRLPNTPFPDAPAGALLVVLTDPGAPSQIQNVQVAQSPATSVVLKKDADAYLVVNDMVRCADNTSNSLTVNIFQLQPGSQAVAGVAPAIAAALQKIETDGETVVQQGRLLPNVAASMRSGAMSAVSTAVAAMNQDFNTYPDSVQKFFVAWIDREIARIEVEIEIRSLERQARAVALDLASLNDQSANAEEQGRLTVMVPAWALRNLDAGLLRDSVDGVVRSAVRDVLPILQVRYPGLLPVLRATNSTTYNALTNLINTPWDASIDVAAQQVTTAGNAIIAAIGDPSKKNPPAKVSYLMVTFPKPGKAPLTGVPYADPSRASNAWAGLTSKKHVATFTVNPEDFYSKNVGYYLGCSYETPVVRDMTVVFSGIANTTTDVFNPQQRTNGDGVPLLANPGLRFPTRTGMLSFQIVPSDWDQLTGQTTASPWTRLNAYPLMAGTLGATDILLAAQTYRPDGTPYTNVGRGLSPAGTFTMDFTALYQQGYGGILDYTADQMVVVFSIESRSAGGDLTWLAPCR